MTDYQHQLQQDVLDMDRFTKGLEAYERLSGVDKQTALLFLNSSTNREQLERLVKVTARLNELAKLAPAQRAAALGIAVEEVS